MRRLPTCVLGLIVIGFANEVPAQFLLTRTHESQVGGTSGPPDAADVAVLDLDEDGNLDIVVYSSEGASAPPARVDYLAYLFGNGDGSFQPVVEANEVGLALVGAPREMRSRLMVGEFSGDAHPDLVVTHRNTQDVALLINDGAGSFQAPLLYDTGTTASSLHVGDYDEDGQDDVLVVSRFGYDLVLLAGTGTGTLAAPVTQPSDLQSLYEPFDFDVADLDGDGHLDALVPYLLDESGVSVNLAVGFRGRGNGSFDMLDSFFVETGPTTFNSPVTLQIADLDADGHLDVAAANYDIVGAKVPKNVHVAYGTDSGWDPAIPYSTSWESFTELTISDVNIDGHLDIVALCDGPMGFEVLLGDGARGFTSQGFVEAQPAAGMFSVLAADLNDDRKPDLVFGTQYTGHVLVYRNDTPGAIAVDFVRGDSNADSIVDISDAVAILGFLFLGGDPMNCSSTADSNDSGTVDLSDAVFLLNHLFLGGSALPAPYPGCGTDATPDELTCEGFAACP